MAKNLLGFTVSSLMMQRIDELIAERDLLLAIKDAADRYRLAVKMTDRGEWLGDERAVDYRRFCDALDAYDEAVSPPQGPEMNHSTASNS